MSRYVNIIIFFVLLYVIVRHFLLKAKDTTSEDDIEKMIRERQIAFGNIPQGQNAEQTNSELDQLLQWGDQNLGEFFSERYFKSDLKFDLNKNEVMANQLTLQDESEKNKLFSYLLSLYLKNKKNIKYKRVSSTVFKLSVLFILGVEESFFEHFYGSKAAVLDYKKDEDIHIDNYEAFISKIDQVLPSVKKFFLLNETEVQNVGKAYSKKELAKMYHPDQMNLFLVPEKFRDHYFKLYSEQFSKLISHQA